MRSFAGDPVRRGRCTCGRTSAAGTLVIAGALLAVLSSSACSGGKSGAASGGAGGQVSAPGSGGNASASGGTVGASGGAASGGTASGGTESAGAGGGAAVGGMIGAAGGHPAAGGRDGTGGAATGGVAGGTGGSGAAGGRGASPGGGGAGGMNVATGGAPGAGGAGASAQGGGTGVGCIQNLWSIDVQLTDGSLLSVGYQLTVVLDDATGKPLLGVTSVQDSGPTGAACAALADGTVKCWLTSTEKPAVGQLGNGSTAATSTTFRATPVVAKGGGKLAGVARMAWGDFGAAACAVTRDGQVYCWGDLTWLAGDGTTPIITGAAQPLTVDGTNPLTGVLQIALGNRQACVLRQGTAGNEVWCWGYGATGELGQGNTANLPHPTKVGGLTNPSAIVISAAYILSGPEFADATACALDGGRVLCWGSNAEGATGINVGTGPSAVESRPTAVVEETGAALHDVVALSNGFGGFSALRADGGLWVWGHEHLAYATSFAANVVALGYGPDTGGFGPFFLTSDGVYHNGKNIVVIRCP